MSFSPKARYFGLTASVAVSIVLAASCKVSSSTGNNRAVPPQETSPEGSRDANKQAPTNQETSPDLKKTYKNDGQDTKSTDKSALGNLSLVQPNLPSSLNIAFLDITIEATYYTSDPAQIDPSANPNVVIVKGQPIPDPVASTMPALPPPTTYRYPFRAEQCLTLNAIPPGTYNITVSLLTIDGTVVEEGGANFVQIVANQVTTAQIVLHATTNPERGTLNVIITRDGPDPLTGPFTWPSPIVSFVQVPVPTPYPYPTYSYPIVIPSYIYTPIYTQVIVAVPSYVSIPVPPPAPVPNYPTKDICMLDTPALFNQGVICGNSAKSSGNLLIGDTSAIRCQTKPPVTLDVWRCKAAFNAELSYDIAEPDYCNVRLALLKELCGRGVHISAPTFVSLFAQTCAPDKVKVQAPNR